MDVDSVVKSERKIPQTMECLLTDKDILIKHGSQHEAVQLGCIEAILLNAERLMALA